MDLVGGFSALLVAGVCEWSALWKGLLRISPTLTLRFPLKNSKLLQKKVRQVIRAVVRASELAFEAYEGLPGVWFYGVVLAESAEEAGAGALMEGDEGLSLLSNLIARIKDPRILQLNLANF